MPPRFFWLFFIVNREFAPSLPTYWRNALNRRTPCLRVIVIIGFDLWRPAVNEFAFVQFLDFAHGYSYPGVAVLGVCPGCLASPSHLRCLFYRFHIFSGRRLFRNYLSNVFHLLSSLLQRFFNVFESRFALRIGVGRVIRRRLGPGG